jgi:hypothetical protein
MSDYYAQAEDVLPLFRRNGPATSAAAARQARLGGQRRQVLEALKAGPAGQTEIGRRCGLLPHQVNKRLADLQRAGLAEPTGREVVNEGGFREREWQIKTGGALPAGGLSGTREKEAKDGYQGQEG